MSAHAPRRAAGFTLLEVLASAIIFAMVITVLVGTSTTAVQRIGTSARELEADLLAEALLADLEIQIRQGIAPAVEEDETEIEGYSVRMSRIQFAPEQNAPGGRPSLPLPGAARNPDTKPDIAGSDVALLLASNLPEVAKFLNQYDIEVSWLERDQTRSVRRTTFAFDWESAAIEYADLFARGQSGGNGPGTGLDADGDGQPDLDGDDIGASRLEDGSLPPVIVRSGTATEAQKAALRRRAQRQNVQRGERQVR